MDTSLTNTYLRDNLHIIKIKNMTANLSHSSNVGSEAAYVDLTNIEKIIDKAKWFIIGFSAFAGVGLVKVVSFVSNFLK